MHRTNLLNTKRTPVEEVKFMSLAWCKAAHRLRNLSSLFLFRLVPPFEAKLLDIVETRNAWGCYKPFSFCNWLNAVAAAGLRAVLIGWPALGWSGPEWCFACLSSRVPTIVSKSMSQSAFLWGVFLVASISNKQNWKIWGPAASVVTPSANSQSCLIAISSTTTMKPCESLATRQIAGIQESRNEDTDGVLNLAGQGPISRSCLPWRTW